MKATCLTLFAAVAAVSCAVLAENDGGLAEATTAAMKAKTAKRQDPDAKSRKAARKVIDTSILPVSQVEAMPVEGEEPSMLPPGKKWKMVWNDEFCGTEIDRTKWMCRESFWGYDFPAFTKNFEGVTLDGKGHVRLNLIKDGDEFRSPHLQTGSLTFDIPRDTAGFWPFGKVRKPLFMHKFGYYEIRCRQPQNPGWHSAFWLQAPAIGADPDPKYGGVECDIMENYRQHTEGLIVGGPLYGGYGKDGRGPGHYRFTYVETPDRWHRYGVDWTPDGYEFYADGKKIGERKCPETGVSHIPQFILISTECGGYRICKRSAGGKIEWGKPDPRLFDAVLPDFFEVDYVRVFDNIE